MLQLLETKKMENWSEAPDNNPTYIYKYYKEKYCVLKYTQQIF